MEGTMRQWRMYTSMLFSVGYIDDAKKIVIIFSLVYCLFLMYQIVIVLIGNRKSKIAQQALFDDCDAGDDLFAWLDAHPDILPSDSPRAQELVRRKISTYQYLLKTHPNIESDKAYEENLRALLKSS